MTWLVRCHDGCGELAREDDVVDADLVAEEHNTEWGHFVGYREVDEE